MGGIVAAVSAPSPQYGADGSVSLSTSPDLKTRIAVHKRQKYFRLCLVAVGVGACLQAIAVFVPVT